jgi:glycosyl transferase family 87
LIALIAGGSAIRLAVAFGTVGIGFDIDSYGVVAQRLNESNPLHLYADVNAQVLRWPYPPGLFPWVLFADAVAHHSPLPLHGVVQLPGIFADAGLAWVVQAYLGDCGADERPRLAAAGLIAAGPSFAIVSGYEGHFDSLAILPAATALLLWERRGPGRRAFVAGVLIGVGATIKTVPLLILFPLLVRASSRREASLLAAAALAIPLLLIAPWVLVEPDATIKSLRYTGVPGIGGLSLFVQPDLADAWLVSNHFHASGLTQALADARFSVTASTLAAVVVVLARKRPEPAAGALIASLAMLTFAPFFGPRYLTWALPFALMAGYTREVVLLQAIAFPAAVLLAGRTWSQEWVAPLYFALMSALFVAMLVILVRLTRRERLV